MKKEKIDIVASIVNASHPEMQNLLPQVKGACSKILKPGQEKLLDKILFAISVVDRKFFTESPYRDEPALIGKGQTIAQPSTVAAMLLHADIHEHDEVLEIGAGSGWNAALLSYLAHPGKVTSIDRDNQLMHTARSNLRHLRKHLNKINPQESERIQVNFFTENILHKEKVWKKKYNKIIFAAGISKDHEPFIKEIAQHLLLPKGILVCPRKVGPIIIFKKDENLVQEETEEHYQFVPLKEGIEE